MDTNDIATRIARATGASSVSATDELYDYPQPSCGLSLLPVREIVVVRRKPTLIDVLVRVNGYVKTERWCFDEASAQMAVAYYSGLYPDATRKDEE